MGGSCALGGHSEIYYSICYLDEEANRWLYAQCCDSIYQWCFQIVDIVINITRGEFCMVERRAHKWGQVIVFSVSGEWRMKDGIAKLTKTKSKHPKKRALYVWCFFLYTQEPNHEVSCRLKYFRHDLLSLHTHTHTHTSREGFVLFQLNSIIAAQVIELLVDIIPSFTWTWTEWIDRWWLQSCPAIHPAKNLYLHWRFPSQVQVNPTLMQVILQTLSHAASD